MREWALEIEREALEAGIRIDALCSYSGVHRSTLTRWKQGATGNGATYRALKSAIAKIRRPPAPQRKVPHRLAEVKEL
jgi:transposase-like protein